MSAPPRIRVEPAALDPLSARFIVDRPLADGGPFLFEGPEAARGQPLAEAIFSVSGIDSIAVTDAILTVRLCKGTHLGDVSCLKSGSCVQ